MRKQKSTRGALQRKRSGLRQKEEWSSWNVSQILQSSASRLMFVKITGSRHSKAPAPPAGVTAGVEHLQAKHVRPLWPALLRVFLYVAALAVPLIAVFAQESAERHSFPEQLADNFGLLGFTILALQFPIAARVKWIEWPFGLDRLFRFHRAMAMFAGFLLLCHPVLMAIGGETQILTDLQVKWPVQIGRLALLVLLAIIGISLSWQKLHLTFEQWRRSHNLLAVSLLLLGFTHSSFVSEDLGRLSMRLIWTGMLIVASTAYIHHRLIWPKYRRAFGEIVRCVTTCGLHHSTADQLAKTNWLQLNPGHKDWIAGLQHLKSDALMKYARDIQKPSIVSGKHCSADRGDLA
ncbi:MAG: ferric reductase-like transmembrane domain-containing protein [Bryobacteraceae bacterium]|nr:ferric reductase-like transmembrane domain-containing protein [Bryobacteraceae bacterium]